MIYLLILKVFSVFSGFFALYLGVSNIFSELTYTPTLVCFYIIELSQFILENYFLTLFPFLGNPTSKSVFFIIVASLCFGSEMGKNGTYVGIALLLAGCGQIFSNFSPIPQTPQFKPEVPLVESSLYVPPNIITK